MSTITRFSLKNFRNFKGWTDFIFPNVSITTGPNSAGKSSLTKAMLLLKENLTNGLLKEKLVCSNSVFSLGSFATVVNSFSKSKVVEFAFSFECYSSKLLSSSNEINVNLKYKSTPMLPRVKSPSLQTSLHRFDTPGLFDECSIIDSNNNLLFSLRNNHTYTDDLWKEYYVTLNIDLIFDLFYATLPSAEILQSIFDYEYESFGENKDGAFKTICEIEKKVLRDYFTDCLCLLDDFENMEDLLGLESGEVYDGLIAALYLAFSEEDSIIITAIDKSVNYYNFYNLIYNEYSNLLNTSPFESIFYVPAERAILNRVYSYDKENTLQDILEKIKYGKWFLSTEFINKWLQKFEIGTALEIDSTESNVYKIFIHNENGKTLLADLGYGVTQLLPIILMASLAIKSRQNIYNPTIIIEEPELNLHPKFQSLISDMIVDSMEKFGKSFIVETHSEYLVRKLQYLVGSKLVNSEDVTIYYLSPSPSKEENPIIKRININQDGSLDDVFGKGFFDEAIHWQLELLHLKNKN